MALESDKYNIFKNRDLFGIYDLETNKYVLDCFDDPRLFFAEEHAEEYRTKCVDYNNDKFQVRKWSKTND